MPSNDTYEGALEVLAKQIGTMMGLADANLPFCTSLLEQVTQERRSPELAMQRAGVLPNPAQNPQAGGVPLNAPMGGGPPSMLGMDAGSSAPPITPESLQALLGA